MSLKVLLQMHDVIDDFTHRRFEDFCPQKISTDKKTILVHVAV